MAGSLRGDVHRAVCVQMAVQRSDNGLSRHFPLTTSLGADWRPDRTPLTLGASFGIQRGGLVRLAMNKAASRSIRRTLDSHSLWQFDARTWLRLNATKLMYQPRVGTCGVGDANGSISQLTTTRTATTFRLGLEFKP